MKNNQGALSRYYSIAAFFLAVWFGQSQMFAISIGDRVRANGTVNVRQTAAGTLLGTQSSGSQGTVIGGPTVASLGGTSYTWFNTNFDSGTDGWVADIGLTLVTANPPSISSVSPNPITADAANGYQTLTINGANFVSKPTIVLTWTGQPGYTLAASQVTFVSSSQLTISIKLGAAADSWTVKAVNPDGKSSSAVGFQVLAPSLPAPSISSVSPNPITADAANGYQTLTINGANFVSKPTIVLTWTGQPGYTLAASQVTFVSSSQLTISIKLGAAADSWTVKATNPDGQQSTPFTFRVDAPNTGLFYLSFPLPNRDPYTAKITSVFDHSVTSPYTIDGVVIAFTGEKGETRFGQSYVTTLNGIDLYGFKQSSGANFTVNGNYTGGGEANFLFYEGHPGIDFRTTDQDPVNGRINVLAAADGVLHWIPNSSFNTIEVDHGNGYKTRYLHLFSRTANLDGATVTRGQVIGLSGDTGAAERPHLHFEVRLNGIEVDPYGWSGTGSDPYTRAVSVNMWDISGAPAPSIGSVTPNPITADAANGYQR